MTNGRGAGMASFMMKKKKYKFQVEVCLEELLEVPFVSAVLFAKLRLLDGGNFQDHSSREEVRDHTVKWGAKFSFPCKMMANASTGVLERCNLRISVRKECKGGRSFNKLGFVDLNLAEYAGAGETFKKALLEGYDSRNRQDNSMLRFSIKMNMRSGDILFKVPSPSLKHKPIVTEENPGENRNADEFSSGSLAGSIASGSSGFGSLPKKRPQLLSSELVIGPTLSENNLPVSVAAETYDNIPVTSLESEETHCEPGHSRNSSNTSQMSKASGYSSIHSHSHSRQSSSGDSGHIRDPHKSKRGTAFIVPGSFPETPTPMQNGYKSPEEVFSTPKQFENDTSKNSYHTPDCYLTPKTFRVYNNKSAGYQTQISAISNSSTDEYKTPECTLDNSDLFSNNFELQKSYSCVAFGQRFDVTDDAHKDANDNIKTDSVLRSKSDYQITRFDPSSYAKKVDFFQNFGQKNELTSFLTPLSKRRAQHLAEINHSTPKNSDFANSKFKVPDSPANQQMSLRNFPHPRTTSLNSLRSGMQGSNGLHAVSMNRTGNGGFLHKLGLSHRKLLEGTTGGKLAPLAISPDETPTAVPTECSQTPIIRRPSVTTNPSSSSLVLSETGSLDRAKAALERRKKTQMQEQECGMSSGRVEETRVNPGTLIAELLKNTNLDQADDSHETSGLQLYIAKDGTAALGNHEMKSQMQTGVQVFKQVVMEDKR